MPDDSRPQISRIDYPAALLGPGAGGEIDPINAVVQGDSGTFPPSVQLASQKIPDDPPPNPEVIRLPDPVPMNIETGGIKDLLSRSRFSPWVSLANGWPGREKLTQPKIAVSVTNEWQQLLLSSISRNP